MSTSALKLITGVIDGKSIRNNVTQAAHGFTAGSVVRYDVNQSNGVGGFTAAKAISSMEAEVSGIVERVVDDTTFVLVYQGEIDISEITTTGNTADEVYFLSSDTAGNLETNPPTVAGHVIKPVLVRRSDTSGLVMNYLGTVIGGEATVSLDGLVPVGTVYPYAGASSDVPTGWSLCDGGTLDTAKYPELYPRISWRYGATQKLTLKNSAGEIPDMTGIQVGDKLQQDIQRPSGMPGDPEGSGGINLIDTIATGTLVSKDSVEGTILIDVDVTEEETGNISTGPLFDNTSSDGAGFRPGQLILSGNTSVVFDVTNSEVEFVHKPDLRSRVPVGANHGDTSRTSSLPELQQKWFRGKIGGEAAHSLSEAELASHTHQSGNAVFNDLSVSVEGNLPQHSHDMTTKGGQDFLYTSSNDTGQGNDYLIDGAAIGAAKVPTRGAGGNIQVLGFKDVGGTITWPSAASATSSGFFNRADGYAHQHSVSGAQIRAYLVTQNNSSGTSISATGTITASSLEGAISIPSSESAGSGENHNNMQPYLVTEYIIRVSSEARAALVTGIDVNLSVEGLNNVTDVAPANKEMLRYSGPASTYVKVQPNIDGFGSKDNEDLVFHTSQSGVGATLEAMRLVTNGRLFLGFTQGNTLGGGNVGNHVHFWSKSKDPEDNLILVQNASDSGQSGAYFGCHQQHVRFWNYGLSGNAGTDSMTSGTRESSRAYEFWFGGLAGIGGTAGGGFREISRRVLRINDTHCIVGTKTFSTAGASLDVAQGGIVAAGDIFTEGGTHGVFASVLGVTSTLGGYNLPVTAGVSGEVLMVHGTGKTLGFFAQAAPVVLWSGDSATGASCSAVNVAIGTGGFGTGTDIGKMGATLEVGGGALLHGGLTIDAPLQIGLGQAHTASRPISIIDAGNQTINIESTDNNAGIFIDSHDNRTSYVKFLDQSVEKASFEHRNTDGEIKLRYYDTSLATDAYVDAIKYNSNAKVALGHNSAIDTDFLVSTGTAGTSGGFYSRAGANLFSVGPSAGILISNGSDITSRANLQVLRSGTGQTGAYIQIGSAHFGASAGTFIGENGANSEILALANNNSGGTLDFYTGKATGATLAMKIHSTGIVQIGGTAGGGYANKGYRGGGGLALTDLDGSTGNSGDILINSNATGQLKWSGDVFIPHKSGETNNVGDARGTHGVGPFDGPYVLVPANFSGAEGVNFDNSITPFFNGKEASGDVTLRYSYDTGGPGNQDFNVTILNDSGHDIVVVGQMGGGGGVGFEDKQAKGLNPAFDYEIIADGASLTRTAQTFPPEGVEPWGMILFWRKVT